MAGREREQGRSPVIGRRRLLGTVAGVAAGGIVGAAATRAQIHPGSAGPSPLLLHSPDLEPFVDELPRPAAISGTALSLHAHASRHRFHRDLPAGDCLAYGGKTYLGPLIEAQRGQPLELTYRNEIAAHPFARDMDTSLHGLGEEVRRTAPTSLHLHGGVTPPDSDGHPEHESRYGQGHVYRFPNDQPAALLWYHDHAMAITRVNTNAGLAGPYLLRDEWDTGLPGNPLGLPAGEFEIPLVMQDKIVTADGSISLRSTWVVPEGAGRAARWATWAWSTAPSGPRRPSPAGSTGCGCSTRRRRSTGTCGSPTG